MATVKEWQDESDKLTDEEAQNVYNALETLESWDFFKKEFGWTLMFSLKTTLRYKKQGDRYIDRLEDKS